MTATVFALIVVIGLAMAFTVTNGFHDSANAIATSGSTRALTLRAALGMAAVGNLVGSFFGAKVAGTVGAGIIELEVGPYALMAVGCALVGAIGWNLLTWWLGLPSSSSHALIGGMVGAALAGGTTVLWTGVVDKILVPMVVSPIAGFFLGAAAMLAIMWIFRRSSPSATGRGFRRGQTLSAAMMAFGHGMQDAAKTMGIVVLALVVAGYQDDYSIPWWCFLLTAAVLAVGTGTGGMRIMRTLGRKIIELDPPQGFAAESTAASAAVHRLGRNGRSHLHHPREFVRDHGRRVDQTHECRSLGRRRKHGGSMGHDLPGRGATGCGNPLGCTPFHVTSPLR